jgi:hypothetical protein
MAKDGVLDDQLPPGPDRIDTDACDLARRSARGQLRPHAAPDASKDHVWIRATLGKRIPNLEQERGSGGTACAARLPPGSTPDAQGSQHGVAIMSQH